jgi:hypothetical protein
MTNSLKTGCDIASTPECDTLRLKPQRVKVLGCLLTFSSRIVIPSGARDLLVVSGHGFSRAEQASKVRGALAPEVSA